MKTIKAGFFAIALSGLLLTTQACDALPKEMSSIVNSGKDKDKKKKKKGSSEVVSKEVSIEAKWEVPDILREVSGIAYMSPDRFACIQDEQGTIFIYNTATAKIEREIDFAGPGDYEGIALVGQTAYVLRADGKVIEVANFESGKPQVTEHSTSFTAENNLEGLCYDPKHNRLLLAVKDLDSNSNAYKGIYSFDLATKRLAAAPVYKIDFGNPAFAKIKNAEKTMMPSEVQVHPQTGHIYVTDAKNAQIVVLNAQGELKNRYKISDSDFYKAEGITFSPTGDLFISNEGKKTKGNILKVKIAGL